MPAVKKSIEEKKHKGAIITNNVGDHSKDPFIVKKVEEAKQTISRVGLPGDKKK